MSYRDIQEERERLEADCSNCIHMKNDGCEYNSDLEEDEMACGSYDER